MEPLYIAASLIALIAVSGFWYVCRYHDGADVETRRLDELGIHREDLT